MCEISVIIPVYNKAKYIVDTLDSVLKQSFTDFEALLIDDGSTDSSDMICDKYRSLDSRFKTFHISNKGVSAARNYGIKHAKGKYISFIDADDIIDSTFFEKMHKAMIDNNADMVVCGYYEINKEEKTDYYLKSCLEYDTFEVLKYNILCTLWNKLFVRSKIKHLFDESISTSEDSLFCARYYYDNNPKIVCVNELLYGYIVRGKGLTSCLQNNAIKGIRKFLYINRLISEQIVNEKQKKLSIHHIYKVYYYGIYMYIFENLSKESLSKSTLSLMDEVLDDKKFQRIIRFILKYAKLDKDAEKTSKTEFLFILFSMFKMKRLLYLLPKVKNVCK